MATTISIKGGSTPTIFITPRINGEVMTKEYLSDKHIFVGFVHKDTRELRFQRELTEYDESSGMFKFQMTQEDTISLVDEAELKTKYLLQFAFTNSDESSVLAEDMDTKIQIIVHKWELGQSVNETIL